MSVELHSISYHTILLKQKHDANHLLVPSFLSIIVYVYSLGKKSFVVRIVLQKTFQQKNVLTACKNMEKNLSNFSTILFNYASLVWV